MSTGQGMLGYNMFAYCGNNPVNRADPSGRFWGLAITTAIAVTTACKMIKSVCSELNYSVSPPYETADEAAMAFANSVYSSSRYIRHEYGTVIYSTTSNGTTTYNYTTPKSGGPHSISIGYKKAQVPNGAIKVAAAHTHPHGNNFSTADINTANNLGITAYVVGPNRIMKKYSATQKEVSVVGLIRPMPLTNNQKAALVSQFQISWYGHLPCDRNFDCENLPWPNG